jgi:hypothetical protein
MRIPLADEGRAVCTLKLTDLLPDAGRPVAYYPILRRLTGSTNATLLLCQLMYWHGKQADKDGWIFKRAKTSPLDEDGRLDASHQSIERETGLTYKEQKSARRQLRERGFLRERRSWIEHRIYFRLDLEALGRAWDLTAPASRSRRPGVEYQRDGSHVPSGSLIKGTYTDYTQTTTEKKTPAARSPARSLPATENAVALPATRARFSGYARSGNGASGHPAVPGGMRTHSGILAIPHRNRNDEALSTDARAANRGATAPILAGLVQPSETVRW